METYDNLIQAWVSYYRLIQEKGDESEKAKSLFWAFDQLDDLCWQEPIISMNIILAILEDTKNDSILDYLAAGPLGSILSRNGPIVIKLIESEAKRNINFQELLKGVWQNQMSDEIWDKVQHAILGKT